MQDDLEHELRKAESLLDDGNVFGALVHAGAVLASVPALSPARHALQQRVVAAIGRADAGAIGGAAAKAKLTFERVQHLLKFLNSKWLVDEVVFLLSWRADLALAAWCARELGLSALIDGSELDPKLRRLATSKRGRRVYAQSLALIEKNWRRRIPFDVDMVGLTDVWNAGGCS